MGVNEHYGTPVNAGDPRRVPGGSSSGSAFSRSARHEAVAAGADAVVGVRGTAADRHPAVRAHDHQLERTVLAGAGGVPGGRRGDRGGDRAELEATWEAPDVGDVSLHGRFDFASRSGRVETKLTLEFSHGMKKKLAMAGALLPAPDLLFLDEPFEGVAPALAQRLAEVVADLKKHGQSVLLSESDHVHSSELLDRLYVIERGAVKEK